MSSPRSAQDKPAKPARAVPGTKVPRGADKVASDAGMTGKDKANFIKAMMEGVKPKAAANPAAGKSGAAKGEKPVTVEILRKIPAPVKTLVPSNPESDQAIKFAALIEAKVAAGELEALTPYAVQALMTALCKYYSANVDAGNKFPVVSGRMAITGTDAMIVCGALLKAVDLQVFELGMWQSWSGI